MYVKTAFMVVLSSVLGSTCRILCCGPTFFYHYKGDDYWVIGLSSDEVRNKTTSSFWICDLSILIRMAIVTA